MNTIKAKMNDEELINQHSNLNKSIKLEPSLGSLIFQGRPLNDHATKEGLQKLLEANKKGNYDPISLNHGIKRLQIYPFKDLVWGHPNIIHKINFEDEIINTLESSSNEIKPEAMAVINDLKKFPDSDTLTNPDGLWSYFPFYNKDGSPIKFAHEVCPIISKIISKLDLNCVMGFAFLSALSKKTKIQAHCGSTSLRKRYHYGITVPDGRKCKIRIGNKSIFWEENKAFSFYDAVEHEVDNDSDELRLLLIFDVWSDGIPVSIKEYLKKDSAILKYGIVPSQ